jgi:transposase
MSNVRFISLDVHAETIAVAAAEPAGEVRSLGVIPNRIESIRKLVKKLGPVKQLRVCYEAGPTGYVVYWQLTALGVKCEVVAPTLVPVKAGDRVKTDRRDALKLARSYRAGDLTFDQAAQEATLLDYIHEVDHAAARIRRLEAAIDAAVHTAPARMRAVIEALQALRGIALVTAVTIAAEVGELSRFAKPRQLMGYSGAVASEDSSGQRTRRGGITKAGNAHLRRVIVEAAWAYRHRPAVGTALRKRQVTASTEVKEIAWKAQHRLHARYRALTGRGKCKQQVVTAIGRELLGFIWAIGVHVESRTADGQPIAA